MERISVIITTLCLFGMVASYPYNIKDTKKKSDGLSLVQLKRSKRFDFSMFACADCRPLAYCRQDADCHNGYSCKLRCCALKCVRDVPSFRAYGNFQDSYQENGRGTQADVANELSSNGSREFVSEELNNADIDVDYRGVVMDTTEVPVRDVPDTSQKLEIEDYNAIQTENDVNLTVISSAHVTTDVTSNIVTP